MSIVFFLCEQATFSDYYSYWCFVLNVKRDYNLLAYLCCCYASCCRCVYRHLWRCSFVYWRLHCFLHLLNDVKWNGSIMKIRINRRLYFSNIPYQHVVWTHASMMVLEKSFQFKHWKKYIIGLHLQTALEEVIPRRLFQSVN